jgi:predicted acetyltransferase
MKLVQVARKYKHIIQDYKNEYLESHDKVNGGCGIHHYANIDDWFDEVEKIALGKSTKRIQSSTYICMESDRMVGMIDIRHHLPKEWYAAGHIGYSIRPSERKKGYATLALKEALQITKKLKIHPVIITCLKTNVGSQKVILNNGGVLIDEIIEENEKNLLYKITK